MNERISVIIPVYNGASTAKVCLEALYKSDYVNFEVIVVDDHSSDNTLAIVSQFPCKIVRLYTHFSAAYARNMGVRACSGDIVFFTDIDCVVAPDTLSRVASHFSGDAASNSHLIIGGTYSSHAYDEHFFSQFQAAFIHYSETKYLHTPDYIASHAMAMRTNLFRHFNGFNAILPLLEDVEFSHRLRQQGVDLLMDPKLQVQHIFNFSLLGSLRNALRKSKYWVMYSLGHHDLLADSGTASYELKINSLAFLVSVFVLLTALLSKQAALLVGLLFVMLINSAINYRFLLSTYRAHGIVFLIPSLLYYFYVFPIAVITGSLLGFAEFIMRPILTRN